MIPADGHGTSCDVSAVCDVLLLCFSVTSSLEAGYGFSARPKMELCSAGPAIAGHDTAGVPPNMAHNWGEKATCECAVMLWTSARIKSLGPGL